MGLWPADFDENLMYYGNGNPGTWNPVVRPGDNKWSMSIFCPRHRYRHGSLGLPDDAPR